MNLDMVLGNESGDQNKDIPCANSQPHRIPTNCQRLHRFPPLATMEGVNPEFQKFFDEIVDSILNKSWDTLYNISDKAVSLSDFIKMITDNWYGHLSGWYDTSESLKNIDIELDMESFQSPHRNILASFNILTYMVTTFEDEFSTSGSKITKAVKCTIPIWFSYNMESGFRLLSIIKPFKSEDI